MRVLPQVLRYSVDTIGKSQARNASTAKFRRKIKIQRQIIPNSKAKQGKKPVESSNPDNYPPYKFGSYSGLTLPDEKTREGLSRFTSKVTDFSQLKIMPEIRKALLEEIKKNTVLRAQNYISPNRKAKTEGELNGLIIRPTPIQSAAIKVINDRRKEGSILSVFTLAAETGSGKTWAYLAPLLQQLLEGRLVHQTEIENVENPEPYIKHKAGIKSVILVPTHELVDQVYTTVDHMAEQLNLNVLKWDLDSNFKVFMEKFKSGIDIMVTTPGKLHSLSRYDSISNPRVIFGSISFCVVDEADTLMDESFIEETYGVLRHMTNMNTLVFSSATYPTKFNKTIAHLFPDAKAISTPSLHKIPKAIEFRVINAAVNPYKGSKMKALAQTLYAIHADGTEVGYEKRVLVFVNSKDDCARVADKLKATYGHNVCSISSNIEDRKSLVQTFLDPPKKLEDPSRPDLKVLVCTDLLSRGLNFQGIRNVVLLDVPSNSADLVHRAGRTGRMNQSGRVFLIINESDKNSVKGLPKVLRNNRRLG